MTVHKLPRIVYHPITYGVEDEEGILTESGWRDRRRFETPGPSTSSSPRVQAGSKGGFKPSFVLGDFQSSILPFPRALISPCCVRSSAVGNRRSSK